MKRTRLQREHSTIDWVRALTALGQQELDVENVQATLGSVLKYHEDQQRIDRNNVSVLVSQALAGDHAIEEGDDAVAVVEVGGVTVEKGQRIAAILLAAGRSTRMPAASS